MEQRPILFSTPMVQAIMEGRKTMTRRICKRQPNDHEIYTKYKDGTFNINGPDFDSNDIECPFGMPGDVLWVRETFMNAPNFPILPEKYYYKASKSSQFLEEWKGCWKPSIFMPKDACRIFLQITNVRVERLNDISELDSVNEGIHLYDRISKWKNYMSNQSEFCTTPSGSFASLWQSIHGLDSWKENPWVWVIEFKRIEKPH